MNRAIYITITALWLLTACSSPQPKTVTSAAAEPPILVTPDCNVAVKFINDYIAHCLPGADRVSDSAWVANNVLLTDGFKAAYQKLRDDAYKADPELGLDVDPIFDAQDFPDNGFELVTCDADSGYVLVHGNGWPEFKVALRVIAQEGKWLVDGAGVINIPDERKVTK